MDRFGATGKVSKKSVHLTRWTTSRLDRPDRNGPFHLTIPTHSQSENLAVWYLPCTKWRKILITAFLWIVNSRSMGVTRTSMFSYHRAGAALQAKCMFWLLTALKDDLFPERIWNVLFVLQLGRTWCLKWEMANIWERSAQKHPLYWLNYYA